MRVLVVEDDDLIGDAIRVGLKQSGYAVDWIKDGVAADQALTTESYAAVVLDLGLPRMSGMEVLSRLRARKATTPVLILTALDALEDRIRGLDAGADDYLPKPFDMGEVAARVRALIRRASGKADSTLEVSGVKLDPATRRVKFRDQPVELSAREFDMLYTFMLSAGEVLSRSKLEAQLYAWGDEISSNAIEVHIHHLRRKFFPQLIETIRGVGYLMPTDKKDF